MFVGYLQQRRSELVAHLCLLLCEELSKSCLLRSRPLLVEEKGFYVSNMTQKAIVGIGSVEAVTQCVHCLE